MPPNEERPKVGVGVMIVKDGKVLMGRRKNSHGAGLWSFVGGYLEAGETFAGCAVRESREEAGLEIGNLRFLCVGNVRAYGLHHVGIGLLADWVAGEAENREPDKREGWEWVDPLRPPGPLFAMSGMMLDSWRSKRLCHDEGLDAARRGKLVRDRIPDLIRREGREPSVSVADDGEFSRRLADKLVEEAKEYAESGDPSELADLLEVFRAVLKHRGISSGEIERLREEKAAARGGFDGRVVLI